jgi:hypothetical protein
MTDPNGWVTSPPSVLVKVHGVASRPAINGCLGLVLNYIPNRLRYTVHLAITQEPVSISAANLQPCSYLEKIQGQYQLLRHDATVQRQVHAAYQTVQTRTGVRPEYVGVGALVIFVAATYAIGFTRMVMMVSGLLLMFLVVAEDVLAGASPQRIATNAPMRWRAMIRQSIPVVGPRIADSPYLSAVLAGLTAFFFVWSMVVASTAAPGTVSSLQDNSWKERYYKAGFDDAIAGVPFGESLSNLEATRTTLAYQYDDLASLPAKASRPAWAYIGTAMSLYYIFNTFQQLGRDGASGQFSLAAVRQNLANMEPWRMGTCCVCVCLSAALDDYWCCSRLGTVTCVVITRTNTFVWWRKGMLGFSIYKVVSMFL